MKKSNEKISSEKSRRIAELQIRLNKRKQKAGQIEDSAFWIRQTDDSSKE